MWSSRGYYTRSKRCGDRVMSEHFGKGPRAEQAAAEDAARRCQQEAARTAWTAKVAANLDLASPVDGLDRLAGLLSKAGLQAAGFHQHARSEWRRRRTNHDGS